MTIGFIGAGNMAGALAGAIVRAHPDARIVASDTSAEARQRFSGRVERAFFLESNPAVVDSSDVTFLAVKPQVMPAVLPELASAASLIVSIAAGVRIAALERALPRARVIRVMPNTPGLVGEMAAGYSAGARARREDMDLVGSLLGSAGVAYELPEGQLDAVTGLSGSGPAFVARLIQAFVSAGIRHGLSREIARELVLTTFSGTARLLREANLSPDELVDMVSSPGGTTVAGRSVLEASGYEATIASTVEAAVKRSKELGT